MSFLYSAIGDNTAENREWLEKIGLKSKYVQEGADTIVTASNTGMFSIIEANSQDWFYEYLPHCIDCRNNPQLFRAVTAMRDDSDYMQWFVTEADQSWVNQGMYAPKGSFELCLVKDRYMGQDPKFCNSIVPAHKATIDELINHFKV